MGHSPRAIGAEEIHAVFCGNVDENLVRSCPRHYIQVPAIITIQTQRGVSVPSKPSVPLAQLRLAVTVTARDAAHQGMMKLASWSVIIVVPVVRNGRSRVV